MNRQPVAPDVFSGLPMNRQPVAPDVFSGNSSAAAAAILSGCQLSGCLAQFEWIENSQVCEIA